MAYDRRVNRAALVVLASIKGLTDLEREHRINTLVGLSDCEWEDLKSWVVGLAGDAHMDCVQSTFADLQVLRDLADTKPDT